MCIILYHYILLYKIFTYISATSLQTLDKPKLVDYTILLLFF